jgi:hypothetical protein
VFRFVFSAEPAASARTIVVPYVQLVVKFLTFYGIREYIVVFTRIGC